MRAPEIGTRVEVGTHATGPQTGIGRRGVVVARREQQSSATGLLLRWIEVDVRLDSGALVTREPRCLRVVSPAS